MQCARGGEPELQEEQRWHQRLDEHIAPADEEPHGRVQSLGRVRGHRARGGQPSCQLGHTGRGEEAGDEGYQHGKGQTAAREGRARRNGRGDRRGRRHGRDALEQDLPQPNSLAPQSWNRLLRHLNPRSPDSLGQPAIGPTAAPRVNYGTALAGWAGGHGVRRWTTRGLWTTRSPVRGKGTLGTGSSTAMAATAAMAVMAAMTALRPLREPRRIVEHRPHHRVGGPQQWPLGPQG